MIVEGGWVVCEDSHGKEGELTVGEAYKVVCYNSEANLVYLQGFSEPVCGMRFQEYWEV